MLIPIHEEMTREALSAHIRPPALEAILAANRQQDALKNQVGHDELHFDNNAIDAGSRYIQQQRNIAIQTAQRLDLTAAWIAFGRLTHTAQDFYSHTNYIALWMEKNADATPGEVNPLDGELLASPKIHSGRLYFPLDFLYFIPPLRSFALARLPADSHGKMNLDSPAQGSRFAYARAAAVKRTVYEFDLLKKELPKKVFAAFCGMG